MTDDAREDAPDEAATEETIEQPAAAVTPPPPTPAPAPAAATPATKKVDGRSVAIGAGIVGVMLLTFIAGLAIGKDSDHPGDGPFGRGSEPAGMAFRKGEGPGGGQMQGGGPGGGPGGGGEMRGGGPGGGEMHGGRGGGPGGGPGGRGGVMGVVEQASDDTLTIAALGGETEAVEVAITDDTTVYTRGDAGARDIEEASIKDLDEGDIVMVRGERPDDAQDDSADEADDAQTRTVTAAEIMILRQSGE